MRHTNILFYSLLGALVSVPYCADAAIRVGNPSRNNAAAYQQLNEIRGITPAGTVAVTAELPIPVESDAVAEMVRSGSENAPVTMSELERCSLVYPNGKFEWVSPNFGPSAGSPATCTAVVELRTRENTMDGAEITLARANVAAGDTVLCNISEFPSFSWLDAAGTVEFPADAAPTRDDVVKQMNAEQKQNPVLKIISTTVVGALGGNAMGQNKEGQDGLLGTSKSNLKGMGIGAAGGLAIGLAGTYGGKVGGDIAMSVGMNAMAGAITGNMMSTGDSVLYIADCELPSNSNCTNNGIKKCLYGTLDEVANIDPEKTIFYQIGAPGDNAYECEGKSDIYYNCKRASHLNFNNASPDCTGCYSDKNKKTGKAWTWEQIKEDSFEDIDGGDIFVFKDDCTVSDRSEYDCLTKDKDENQENRWVKVKNMKKVSKSHNIVIYDIDSVLDTNGDGKKDKRGYSEKKYNSTISVALKEKWNSGALCVLERRGATTEPFNNWKELGDEFSSFSPSYIDSETGALIDMSNRARLKDTVVGATTGGALGAFSAYQGAQTEIEDRLNAERRAYKDGLQKFYCVTGNRFLTFYNEELVIPKMTPIETDEDK